MERFQFIFGMAWGTWDEILEALKWAWASDFETTLNTKEVCRLPRKEGTDGRGN